MLDEEELRLVHKAVEFEMQEIKAGRIKTKTLGELEKKYGLR